MNAILSRSLSVVGAALFLLGAGTFGAPDAMAGDKHRNDFRRHDGQALRAAGVRHEVRTHERERRAFVAGAVAQQHREDNRNYYRGGGGYGYRDGYADRYRDRYYDDHDDHDDNGSKIGAALVGAAVGAVVTGVVMSNKNSNSSTSTTSSNSDSK